MRRKQAARVMAAGWRWGIVLWLLAANAPAQSGPDLVIFNEDDATGAGYYDASVPSITAPSVRSGPAADAYTLIWPSAVGRSFQVEYLNDRISWLNSPSGFVMAPAGGSVCSWVDAGPPATDSAPDTSTRRFYRVFRFGAP